MLVYVHLARQQGHAWFQKNWVKLSSREKVSSLNIYISDDIDLFAVSKLTECGKFRYQIDHISKTYICLKSATKLWVKHAHLVALQLSNTGLSVEFIASRKLINQSPDSQFLDRALKQDAKKLNWMLTTNGFAPPICLEEP